jgi:hypothetical protein
MSRTLFLEEEGNAAVFGLPRDFGIGEEIEHSSSLRLATAYAQKRGSERLEPAILKSKGKVYLLTGLEITISQILSC